MRVVPRTVASPAEKRPVRPFLTVLVFFGVSRVFTVQTGFSLDLFCQRLRNEAGSQVCSSQLAARHMRQKVLAGSTSRASPSVDEGRRDALDWVHRRGRNRQRAPCMKAAQQYAGIRLQLVSDAYFPSSPFDPVAAVSSPDLPLLFQAAFALRRAAPLASARGRFRLPGATGTVV